MAFQNHNIRDAQWGSYRRLPGLDTQYPPITAHTVDRREFSDDTVEFDTVFSRFTHQTHNVKEHSFESQVEQKSVGSTSVVILSACPNRKGYTIHNAHASGAVYLHEGSSAAATVTNATAVVVAGEAYKPITVWTGEVKAITTGTTVTLNVTDHCPSGYVDPAATVTTTTSTSTTSTSTSTTSTSTSTTTESTTTTSTTTTSTTTTTCDPFGFGSETQYVCVDCQSSATVHLSDPMANWFEPEVVMYTDLNTQYRCADCDGTTIDQCEESKDGDISMTQMYADCAECINDL